MNWLAPLWLELAAMSRRNFTKGFTPSIEEAKVSRYRSSKSEREPDYQSAFHFEGGDRMNWVRTICAALIGIMLTGGYVLADQGQPTRGRALAERWCAKCHAVAPGNQSPEPGIPSFRRMAADPENTAKALRQFITLPHFEMPPQTLTTAEIDDVIAYILSLRSQK